MAVGKAVNGKTNRSQNFMRFLFEKYKIDLMLCSVSAIRIAVAAGAIYEVISLTRILGYTSGLFRQMQIASKDISSRFFLWPCGSYHSIVMKCVMHKKRP